MSHRRSAGAVSPAPSPDDAPHAPPQRPRAAPNPSQPAEFSASPSRWRMLTQVAFVLSLALVACRILMPETIRSATDPLGALRPAPANAGTQNAFLLAQSPASTGAAGGIVLDLLACLPALLVLCRRALDDRYRLLGAWSFAPMALFASLAAFSTLWATDKFASVVSASHLVAALVFIWSSCQLIRAWGRLRLVAGLAIGLLMALSVVGYTYHILELQDLRQTWDQSKGQILAQHGWSPQSVEAQMFEKRVLNGQPMGFSTSTNTFAGLLVLLGVVAAGVIIQRSADKDHWGWSVAPALAIGSLPLAIHWTACRAAYVTPLLAGAILAIVALAHWWARARSSESDARRTTRALGVWRGCYFLVLAGIICVTSLLVRHGLRHGTLWHDSLTFRWRYWTGAFGILTSGLYRAPREFSDFLIGVGWENFGANYLVHRLPNAPEEIRDPHNFVVRAFVELGVTGGILLLAWMLRLWWELTRPGLPEKESAVDEDRGEISGSPSHAQRIAFLTVGSISAVAIAINILEAIDFNADGAYVLLELMRRGLFLILLAAGMLAAAARRSAPVAGQREAGNIHFALESRPAPWILYAILAAVGTFLIHNLIEFSLFEPGPMFLFALLVGAALGIRGEGHRQKTSAVARKGSRRGLASAIGAALAGAAWLAAVIAIAIPIISAESLAHDADSDILAAVKSHDQHFLKKAAAEMADAFHAVPYNADYARRAAQLLIADGADRNDPNSARQMLDAAVAANPSVQHLVLRAQYKLADPAQIEAGLSDYGWAVELDPNNVRMRLDYARELLRAAKTLHRPRLAGSAAFEFYRALDYNAQLPADEIKRLSPGELAAAQADKTEADLLARDAPKHGR